MEAKGKWKEVEGRGERETWGEGAEKREEERGERSIWERREERGERNLGRRCKGERRGESREKPGEREREDWFVGAWKRGEREESGEKGAGEWVRRFTDIPRCLAYEGPRVGTEGLAGAAYGGLKVSKAAPRP